MDWNERAAIKIITQSGNKKLKKNLNADMEE